MKVRVAAVITRADSILLVEHRRRGASHWTLPGGRLEASETIEECLVREVKEEAGLDIRAGRLLFVADVIPFGEETREHVVNLVFHAVAADGELVPGHGDRADEQRDRVEFVPIRSLSDLGMRPPLAEEIALAFREGFRGEAKYLGDLWQAAVAAP